MQQEKTINDRQEGNEGERDFIDEYTASPEPGHDDERDNDRAGARTQDRAGSSRVDGNDDGAARSHGA